MLQTLSFQYSGQIPDSDSEEYSVLWKLLDKYTPITTTNKKRILTILEDLCTIQKGVCRLEEGDSTTSKSLTKEIDALSRLLSAYKKKESVTKSNCIIHIGDENITIHLDELQMVDSFVRSLADLITGCNIQVNQASKLSTEEYLSQAIDFCQKVVVDNKPIKNPRLQAVIVLMAYYNSYHWFSFENENQHTHFVYDIAEWLGLIDSDNIREEAILFKGEYDNQLWNTKRSYLQHYIKNRENFRLVLVNEECPRKELSIQ